MKAFFWNTILTIVDLCNLSINFLFNKEDIKTSLIL